MKNRINVYICQSCGKKTITIDSEEGVTPFMIGCEICDGDMYSSFYKVDQSLIPTHEWYKPTDFNQYPLNHRQAMKQHVADGGLDIRLIKKTGPHRSPLDS